MVNMPNCSAINCSNGAHNGVGVHRFPRDRIRRAIWIKNCRRDKWSPAKNGVLCDIHFEENQFETKRLDGKRLLKWNAIPTVFDFPNKPKVLTSRQPNPLQRNRAVASTSFEIEEAHVPVSFQKRSRLDHEYCKMEMKNKKHHSSFSVDHSHATGVEQKQSVMSGSERAARGELELFMECEEEELTASQRLADIQAQKKYKTALKNIGGAGKSVHSPVSQKIPILPTKAPVKAKRRDSSDVIIIDNPSTNIPVSPAGKQVKQLKTSAVVKAGSHPIKGTKANTASSTTSSYQSTPSSNPSSLRFASLSSFPSLQSTASSATNLILASSNMSNLHVPQSMPAGMIIPGANMLPYLTLPTAIRPSYLTMGKKLLLAVPVLTATQPNFVISTGVNQLQMLNNANTSLGAIPQALGGAMSTELRMLGHDVYLQSGQLPSESASVKEVLQNRILSSPKQFIKSELMQNTDDTVNKRPSGRGRPRKLLASPRPWTDGDVLDDQKLVLPQGTGRVVKKRRGRRRKILAPLPRTSDKISGDVDHGDVQLVVPFQITKSVKPNDIWERKSHRNSEKSLVSPVRSFGTRSHVEKPLASPVKASRYTGIKRSAKIMQDKSENQAELVSKRPKLIVSLVRRRRRKRVSRLSWCKRRRQTPQNSDQNSNQSESTACNPRGKALQNSARPTVQIKEENAVAEEEESSSTSIPLDEYCYGRKDGDPNYREEKGEYRFKCWYCHKMLYNNFRLMQHVQAHIDNEKHQLLDLNNLTQCKHCYRQFDTPFEMRCHVVKMHQNKSSAFCHICEKKVKKQVSSYDGSESALSQHMKTVHGACEMPYACALCGFRSSFYSDVIDHFKKCHDSSQNVLCLYCLKTVRIPFYKSTACGTTKHFFQHIQRHQNKSNNKRCVNCKLTFLKRQEVDHHRARDHLLNHPGTQNSAAAAIDSSIEQVLTDLRESGVKLLSAPEMPKPDAERALRFNGVGSQHLCVECKKPMGSSLHYKNYAECTLCRFATSCCDAFSSHMIKRHSGVVGKRRTVTWKGAKMKGKMFCICGFSSMHGAVLANHLVSCSKRTCYSSKPTARHAQEESTSFEPFVEDINSKILKQETSISDADIPSLFGALGLVKRQRRCDRQQSKTPGMRSRLQVSSEVIVNGIMEDLLDSLFPAEAAASHVIDCLLDRTVKAATPRVGRRLKRSAQLKKPRLAKAIGASTKAVGTDSVTMDKDLPIIDPLESTVKEEPVAKRKRRMKSHSKEVVDIFWNMPVIEKMETAAELAEWNAREEACCDETDSETEHDVKFNVVKVKLEADKDLESSDALEATKNSSMDDSILDDFLITMNDDSAEINDDGPEETAMNTDNAIDYEQCSSDCVVSEGQRGPIATFDDISNVDDRNGVCNGEMDITNSEKTVQDNDTVSELCEDDISNVDDRNGVCNGEMDIASSEKTVQGNDTVSEVREECDDLHCESLTEDLNFLDSVQRGNVTKLVVIQQQEEEKSSVRFSDNPELETIHHNDCEAECRLLNKNDCDLENEKINSETFDPFTVELNAGECNQISDQCLSDQHSSSEHCQSVIEDYITTPVVPTEDLIGAADNVQDNQQKVECQLSVDVNDAGHKLSSLLEIENDREDSGENEGPDTPCTVSSCDHKDKDVGHDINTNENFETGEKFDQDSTNSVSDVLQPVERFHGKEETEIDEDGVTSLCPVNLEGHFDAGNDDKDIESSLDCDIDRAISVPSINLENQDVVVNSEDKDVDTRLNSQLSEVACSEDNTKLLEFDGKTVSSSTLCKSACKEIPLLDGASAKDTRHSETKADEQSSSDSRGLPDKAESLGAKGRQSHSSGHHGSSTHRDLHKSGSSHYKDQGQRGRDEWRESRSHEQRRSERRDYDRRDYDRRDYDQRDYYSRDGHGSGNRSGSHGRNKNESYGQSHGYRHDRGDHYEDRRDYFSRREQPRNLDSDRNRNSSNFQRNYYH